MFPKILVKSNNANKNFASNTKQEQSDICHFPGLNHLRFIAASLVVVHHLEGFKSYMGLPSLWSLFPITCAGKEGVRLFFVLSGFLITYLLLLELKKNSNISLFKFYLRRSLRIWPLYFLITFLAFFVMPVFSNFPATAEPYAQSLTLAMYNHFWEKLGLYLCFLPNFCQMKFEPVLNAGHLWSLGVEEQYYFIWPIILLLFKRFPVAAMIAVVLIKWGLRSLINYGIWHTQLSSNHQIVSWGTTIYNTLEIFDAESFALGGLAAYFLLNWQKQTKALTNYPAIILLALSTIILCFSFDFAYRGYCSSLAFTWLVLFVCQFKPLSASVSKKNFLGQISNFTDYLGKISYGIYMFHPLVITLVIQTLFIQGYAKEWSASAFSTLAYLLIFTCTFLISSFSFKYFEQPFLRMKAKATVLRSSP